MINFDSTTRASKAIECEDDQEVHNKGRIGYRVREQACIVVKRLLSSVLATLSGSAVQSRLRPSQDGPSASSWRTDERLRD